MNNNLLIIGAGEYGHVAREIANDLKCFDKIDFLDDNSEVAIGKWDEYEKFVNEYSKAFIAVGDNYTRLVWMDKLTKAGYVLPTLIHPRAYVFSTATVGRGTIIEPMATVHSGVVVGDCCIVAAGSVICHNAVIEDAVNCFSACVIEENARMKRGSTAHVNEVVRKNAVVNPYGDFEYNFDLGM